MDNMNNLWHFVKDEQIPDSLGDNYLGILSNGEDFLFYHTYVDEEDNVERLYLFESLADLMNNVPMAQYAWSEANDQLLLYTLNYKGIDAIKTTEFLPYNIDED